MKRIKHLLLLLSFASLSIPTLAQYVPEAMELDSDSVVVDSIEGFETDFKVSLDSLRLLVEQNPQDGKAWLNLAGAYWYQDADTTLFEQALQKCVSLLSAANSDDMERACRLVRLFRKQTHRAIENDAAASAAKCNNQKRLSAGLLRGK